MKFVHIADLHLDSAFVNLSSKPDLGTIRRLDQREALKKAIEYIQNNDINYLFISGDLYEHKTIRESTIEYVNTMFQQIPNTQIFITPGNHDPLIKNSYYKLFSWPQNVHIFGEKITKIKTEECNIYGYGFEDFNPKTIDLNEINIDNKDQINIFMTHANLDGSKLHENYNPITTKELNELGFDYIALGHIHKPNLQSNNQLIVYPGSTCALGFDELGEHGMIVGEISKEQDGEAHRKIKFMPLDTKEFVRTECAVDNFKAIEDLADHINNIELDENKMYEILLTGGRFFEIDKYILAKLIKPDNIIKIKDLTKIGINIDEIAEETSLRGIFVKKMLEKRETLDKETFEKAIEYGLESLSGK